MTIFQPFPKLARLSRGCTITEKLDGTNAQVYIVDPDTLEGEAYEDVVNAEALYTDGSMLVFAGSRTRIISPGKLTDNFGFAAWVQENAEEMLKLGPGRHFGEWYGQGIQRGYGLSEKRFALFDTSRWPPEREKPSCVSVVPVLHHGEFTDGAIQNAMDDLKLHGSFAAKGFMDPEGIVIYHHAARCSFKKTYDDRHKEAA